MTQALSSAVADLGAEQMRSKVMRWLSSPDVSINHIRAIKDRHQGTGDWFIKGEDFLRWKAREHFLLWLHGIPGCGKTILSSTIIEELKSGPSACPVIYFYFDFNDEEK